MADAHRDASWPPAPPDAIVEKLVIGRAPFARPVGSRLMEPPQFRNDGSASSAGTGLTGRTMEFATGFGWTRLPMLAAAFILGSVLTVSAQIISPFSPAPAAAPGDDEAETAEAPDVNDPDVLRGVDVNKLDWGQLAIDAGTLNDIIAAKKRAQAAAKDGLNWATNANANGTSAVTVKQSVSSFWDA